MSRSAPRSTPGPSPAVAQRYTQRYTQRCTQRCGAKLRRAAARWIAPLGALLVWACADAPTATTGAPDAPGGPPAANRQSERHQDALATTRWNQRATDLLERLPAPPNGQAWASRMLTYLSLAQYRAALAAAAPAAGPRDASPSAAVARASVNVLRAFYAESPGVAGALERQLRTDRRVPGWSGDVAAGEAIGAAAAEAVLARAARDGYLSRPAPTPPPGEGYWIASGPAVRSLWGATPFFLEPHDLLRAPAPPAYGSPAFRAAVDEVYAILRARTDGQLEIANRWNKLPPNGAFTAGDWNRTADTLIRAHRRTELEAARVLAYANAAAFDAQIDCFATKFAHWTPRPSHVDPRLVAEQRLAFAPPNHPSYPSGHSCISSALAAVLSAAFPGERRRLAAMVEEAGMSRIYAGIHYRFDVEAGRRIGFRAAAKARAGSLE